MLIETPISRATDPHSSHDAEIHLNKSGVRARQQNIVLKVIEEYPNLTSLELAVKANMCRYMLARRLPELAGVGKLHRGQIRTCNESGRLAQTWLPIGHSDQLNLFGKLK